MVFSAIFWATFFIMIGISIIVKSLFNIDIPIAQIFLAIFFIYLGVNMLMPKKSKFITMNESQAEHTVVFSKQTIDLSHIEKETEKQATIVFGKSAIIINPNIPTKITIQGAFSQLKMPGNRYDGALMGKTIYTTRNFAPDRPYALIEVVAVFSNVKIIEKQ